MTAVHDREKPRLRAKECHGLNHPEVSLVIHHISSMGCCHTDKDALHDDFDRQRCACRGVVALVIAGVVCLALLVVVPLALSALVSSSVAATLVVDSTSSPSYSLWESNDGPDASPPERFSVYVFNVTNAREVIDLGAVPRLAQLGPFVYHSTWRRFDVAFAPDGRSVQYYTFNSFHLDLEASAGDPRTTIVTALNLPVLGLRAQLGDAQWPEAMLADIVLDAFNSSHSAPETPVSPLFVTQNVEALVWGFDSPLLAWLNATLVTQESTRVSLQHNSTSEASDRAFFGERDEYATGKDDISQLNRVLRWTRFTSLPWWGNESDAQKLQGTDGHGFTPPVTEHSQLRVWANEVYRPITFTFTKHTRVHDLPTLRFELEQQQFDNTCSVANPSCAPFWLHSPNGLTNLSAPLLATTGVPLPIFLSQPRFSKSDPWYRKQVTFLPPNDGDDEALLQTFLDIEPTTGVVLNASKRLQVVAQLTPSPLLWPKLRTTYLPLFWFELSATITPSLAAKLSSQLALPHRLSLATMIVAPSLAVICFLSSALLWRLRVRQRSLPFREPSVQGALPEYAALLSTTDD